MQEIFEKDSFSNLEWELMLNAGHIKKYVGFIIPPQKHSDREILHALEHLVRSRILNSDGEQFYLNDRYQDMMLYLRQPEEIMKVYARDSVVQLCCCYKRNQYFVSEPDSQREDGVKTFRCQSGEWFQYLKDSFLDYLPQTSIQGESWMKEELQNQRYDADCLSNSFEQNRKRPEVLFQLDCIDGDSGVEKYRLLVKENSLFPVVQIKTGEGRHTEMPYDEMRVWNELHQLFLEEEK